MINQNRKLAKVSVNSRVLTEKDKLKMLGTSSESMKSQQKRAGKFKPTLGSIVEHVDFSDSDISINAEIDAEISTQL